MSSAQAIISQYYDHLKNRNREGLLALLSPQFSVRYYGPEGLLPFGGEHTGVDGIDRFFAIIQENFDILEVETLDTVASDTKVFVQARGRWHCKTTGKEIKANMVNVFTVDDGKLLKYEVYNDTAAFAMGMDLLS